MEITIRNEGSATILHCKGRIDILSREILQRKVEEIVKQGTGPILLCLKEVDFITSAGLGCLVTCLKLCRLANRRFVLTDLASYIQEMMEITQLSAIFEIAQDEKAALERIAALP
ncbi:MAG: STAS domain-containing protein [Patescibacteria group bacterium]|jgi:anti-anti-sigma factor